MLIAKATAHYFKGGITMLYNSHLFASCIEKISREICNNAEFQQKCNQKFTDIVYAIKDGFKDTLGFLPTSLWVSRITNPENRLMFSKIAAQSILSENILEEILSSISSEDEFEPLLRKKIYQIINDDKLITKFIVDNFISMETSLPKFLYENDRMKRFLYGNFSLDY